MRDEQQHPDSAQDPASGNSADAVDLAALYVAGAMAPDEQRQFETRLAADTELQEALSSFNEAADAIWDSIEPVTPDPSVRQALLGRIAAEAGGRTELPTSARRIRRAAKDRWRPTPMAGITMRILNINRAERRFSALFRIEAGATYPSHVHDQPEEIFMLEGDLDFGDYALAAGDYLRHEAGSTHSQATTKGGCVCLVTAELPDFLAA